jgi:hypothetical protein
MNAGNRGRPFQYPEPFIAWMACIYVSLQMSYHQMGVCPEACNLHPHVQGNRLHTLFRRITLLNLSFNVTPEILAEDIVIAVDSTGIKVTNRGEWMREKWKVQRGSKSMR